MKNDADIIIIGAGALGTAIAWELANRNAGRIMVFEKSGIGQGATGQAAGLIRHHYMEPEVVTMAQYSAKKLEHFQEETGYSIDYVKNGFCYIESKSEEELSDVVAMQRGKGIPIDLLGADELKQIHPRGEMNTEGVGAGMYDPNGAYADPYKLAVGYAKSAMEKGVEFFCGKPVEKILVEDGMATGVLVDGTEYHANWVIMAAGLGAPEFLKATDVEIELIPLPLGHIILIPDQPFEPDILTICDASDARNMYFIRPESGGTVLLGSDFDQNTLPIDPDTYYQKVSYERMMEYFRHLTKRFPFLKEYQYKTAFGALDIRTADWNPGIGCVKDGIRQLYYVIGGSGHCFKLAPAIGRYVAEEIMGEAHEFDADLFDINRLIGMKDNAGSFFINE